MTNRDASPPPYSAVVVEGDLWTVGGLGERFDDRILKPGRRGARLARIIAGMMNDAYVSARYDARQARLELSKGKTHEHRPKPLRRRAG